MGSPRTKGTLVKNRTLSLILTLLAVFCLWASPARAGTCNPSYPNSLPQTSGSGGAMLASDGLGQTPPGFITHMEGVGGPGFNFVYTPSSGPAVPFTISFGASSGVVCTSNQVGGWGWSPTDRLRKLQFSASGNSTLIYINDSTAPSNLINCVGLVVNTTVDMGTGNGISKVSTGPETQQLSFGGYKVATGVNYTSTNVMNGTCRFTYASWGTNGLWAGDDNAGWMFGNAPGAASVQYWLDGVNKGSQTGSSPFWLSVGAVTTGNHTIAATATWTSPPGTIKGSSTSSFFVPQKVSTGNGFSCSTQQWGVQGGFAKCWGWNAYGQLGANTSAVDSDVPLDVVDTSGVLMMSKIVDISAGHEAACAVNDGGVACWGKNSSGILGVTPASMPQSLRPVQVIATGSNFKTVSVGRRHACALNGVGEVWCWGNGQYGQLFNLSSVATNITPQAAASASSKVVVTRDTTFILKWTGRLLTAGRDEHGQAGNGTPLANVISAPATLWTSGVTDVWAGLYHGCARVSGVIKCWGSDYNGELGTGSATGVQASPVTASVWPSSIISLGMGDGTTCAILSDHSAKCIGYNAYGNLGIGTVTTMELTPVQPVGYGTGQVYDISASYSNVCAYSSGSMQCAGYNEDGEIGNPAASSPQTIPMSVWE